MRIAVALGLACAACIRTSQDTDGHWASLTEPCVRVGDTQLLLQSRSSVVYVPAGDTLLYSSGLGISQRSLATGEDRVVLRSDGLSEFGTVGDELVYYESNGDPMERRPIDVIIDHGARSTQRYQRISPRPGRFAAGLLTTPAGIYWWTVADDDTGIEEWRWNPETRTVEPFVMNRGTIVRRDDTSFFYFDAMNRLIVRAQTGGDPSLEVALDETLPPPLPIGIDGAALYYAVHRAGAEVAELVARDADGTERLLATGAITSGTIDPTYVYFTDDMQRENVLRVPRAGGSVETLFAGGPNTAVFDVVADRCNVYWQQFTIEGGAIYAREITP